MIPLTRGLFTIVDDEDHAALVVMKWHASGDPGRLYACHRVSNNETLRMHRVILGAVAGQIVDHVDGDTLNNSRSNLRLCTQRQNSCNRVRGARDGRPTSRFKGVYFDRGWWRAKLLVAEKQTYLGYFRTEEQAARAYDRAALLAHGEFARLNFSRGSNP